MTAYYPTQRYFAQKADHIYADQQKAENKKDTTDGYIVSIHGIDYNEEPQF